MRSYFASRALKNCRVWATLYFTSVGVDAIPAKYVVVGVVVIVAVGVMLTVNRVQLAARREVRGSLIKE